MSKGPNPPAPIERPPVPNLPPPDPSPSDPCAEPIGIQLHSLVHPEVGSEVVIAATGTGHIALGHGGELGPIPDQYEPRLIACERAGWRVSGLIDSTDASSTTIRIWGARDLPRVAPSGHPSSR